MNHKPILLRTFQALVALTAAALAATSAAPSRGGTPSQFDDFEDQGQVLDSVRGEWLNLETQLVKPILVTSDGEQVVVANPADDRVVVLDADLTGIVAEVVVGQGPAALAQRTVPGGTGPGAAGASEEVWVSVRHQSSIVVLDRQTWRIKALLRPPIDPAGTGAGIAAAPGGIAFNASRTKAFVAAGFSDELLVFDAAGKTFLTSIPLRVLHNTVATALNDPLAVVGVGETIFVVSHLSGNQTIADTFDGSAMPKAGPASVTVKDLDDDPQRSLPDFDVLEVDAVTDTVAGHQSGVGTTLFGIVHLPATDELVVSGFEARNGDLKGEGSFPEGRVVFNRLTRFQPGDPPSSYTVTVTEDLGPGDDHVVMPTDMAVDGFGRLYVAGYASANVGVWSAAGSFLAALPAESGPRGLAFSSGRLYVHNQAAGTVAYYDVSGPLPPGPDATAALPDPTYDDVKAGRQVFLDPTHSGAGTTGCFSCHQDLRKDGLGWILGKTFEGGSIPVDEDNAAIDWKDNKGVMVTQDLRSLAGVAPYHWRGEQHDLEDFNAAFENLLHGTPHDPESFAAMKAFTFSAVYPPNPFQQMNRNLTADGVAGLEAFDLNCARCHVPPTGTSARISDPLFERPDVIDFQALSDKPAQLRGLWTKLSDLADVDDTGLAPDLWPAAGFGLLHDGGMDTPLEFVTEIFLQLSPPEQAAVATLLEEFDTGLAPSTQYSEWLSADTIAESRVGDYLIGQAVAGHCDIAMRGRMRLDGVWTDVGFVFDRASQRFVPDDSGQPSLAWLTLLIRIATGDAELLALGVPVWSGERIGVDRDRDGVFDRDELAAGLDPADPDTDGDGLWDGYDPDPPDRAPEVLDGSVRLVFVTTNSAKVVYETDDLSPTRVEFGLAPGGDLYSAGDPPVLPPGSNRWKRRHTVFLRPQPDQGLPGLIDGADYRFRIHTRGQNGAVAISDEYLLSDLGSTLLQDSLAGTPSMRVESIDLTAASGPDGVTWTATLQLVDNDGAPPIDPVELTGRFTHFNEPAPMVQIETTLDSDPNGVLVFTSTVAQDPGDLTVFDVPMHTAAGKALVNWSESLETCVEGQAP